MTTFYGLVSKKEGGFKAGDVIYFKDIKYTYSNDGWWESNNERRVTPSRACSDGWSFDPSKEDNKYPLTWIQAIGAMVEGEVVAKPYNSGGDVEVFYAMHSSQKDIMYSFVLDSSPWNTLQSLDVNYSLTTERFRIVITRDKQ